MRCKRSLLLSCVHRCKTSSDFILRVHLAVSRSQSHRVYRRYSLAFQKGRKSLGRFPGTNSLKERFKLEEKNEPFDTGEKQTYQDVVLNISWKAAVECQMITEFLSRRPKLAILPTFSSLRRSVARCTLSLIWISSNSNCTEILSRSLTSYFDFWFAESFQKMQVKNKRDCLTLKQHQLWKSAVAPSWFRKVSVHGRSKV